MRPVRLELEGFTSFRERTVVDFEGVELFALAGPTGAGKSSVIDAMIFALYGTVPRLDDERQVAPVVSQGRTEARVRLDFDVGGERWTAVRVVRLRDGRRRRRREATAGAGGGGGGRQRPGAGRGDRRPARADLPAVHDLRGPAPGPVRPVPPGQAGRAAGPARPAAGAGPVRRRPRGGRAGGGAPGGGADGAARPISPRWPRPPRRRWPRSRARCERLDALVARRGGAPARADRGRAAPRRMPRRSGPARRAAEAPRRSAPTDRRRRSGRPRRRGPGCASPAPRKRRRAPSPTLERARDDRLAAGDRGPLERWQRAHEEQPAVEQRAGKAAADLEAARQRATAAAAAHEAAAREAETLAGAYDALIAEHRAAALRGLLVVGEPCPVCDQPVTTVPHHDEPAELAEARAAREQASRGRCRRVRRGPRRRGRGGPGGGAGGDGAEADRQVHAAALEGAPPAAEVAAGLARLAAADEAVAAAEAARGRGPRPNGRRPPASSRPRPKPSRPDGRCSTAPATVGRTGAARRPIAPRWPARGRP